MRAWDFYRLFHARGMTLTKLAKELGTTHSHLSQVISGSRGANTRKHIVKFLTKEETTALGWEEVGSFVPDETMFPVEPPGGGANGGMEGDGE